MSIRTLAAGLVLTLGCALPTKPAAAGDPAPEERPIDLCLCLDTSNSMDGLIDSARRKLWDVVNDLACVQPKPHLRVALLSYGNNHYGKHTGWVRLDAPFTEDLDFISQKLFALTTRGGEEYVARVLDASLERLQWSADPKALRIALVAGNESADQDGVLSYRDVCAKAAKRGVIVNSIYCGDAVDAIASGWRDVAQRAEGEFAAIDQSRGAAPVCATPYDDLLAKLSTSLNATYIPYGTYGAASCANQLAQDGNALGLGVDAAASRAATKAGVNYSGRNGGWDLVDAVSGDKVDVAKLSAEDLPEAMRKLDAAQRAAYVAEMAKKRAQIEKEIAELAGKRAQFLETERRKQGVLDELSLDGAVRRAVRRQAERKGFSFDGC
jgi:hypothetical protein